MNFYGAYTTSPTMSILNEDILILGIMWICRQKIPEVEELTVTQKKLS